MSKLVELKIYFCDQCDKKLFRLEGLFCIRLQRFIKDSELITIPRDCPLPDAKEEENAEIS